MEPLRVVFTSLDKSIIYLAGEICWPVTVAPDSQISIVSKMIAQVLLIEKNSQEKRKQKKILDYIQSKKLKCQK